MTFVAACGAKASGDKPAKQTKADAEYVFNKQAPFYDLDSRIVFEETAPDGAFVVTEEDLGIGGAERFYLYRTGGNTFDGYSDMKGKPEARLKNKFEINRVGDYTLIAILDNGKIARAKIECNGGLLDPDFLLQREMLLQRVGEYTDTNFPDQKPLIISTDGTISGFYTEGPAKLEFQKDFFGAIRNIVAFPKADNPKEKMFFEAAFDVEDDTITFTPYDIVTEKEDLERAGETGDWAFIPSEGTTFFPSFKRKPGNHEWLHTDALTSSFFDWFGHEKLNVLKKELEEVKNPNEFDKWNLRLINDILSVYYNE